MKKDYVFLVELTDGRSGTAYCSSEGLAVEQAKAEVAKAIRGKEGREELHIAFLGLLDYSGMDPEVGRQLHRFEKTPPVWLWFGEISHP